MPGWINVDQVQLPGVDLLANLDGFARAGARPFPYEDNSVDQFMMSHTIEHITNTLPLMQELHRIAKPDATITIRCPYGSSDDADEDPTHVRRYFLQSWGYFSQPYYWKAQYNTKHEKDVFGRWLHQNPLCPWHVPQSLPSDKGRERSEENPVEETERSSSFLEGRLHLSDRPGRDSGVRTQMGNGTASGPSVIPVGERPSRQWGSVEQFTQELGALVQATAGRTEIGRLVELGRFVLSEAVAQTPEIGSKDCCCTRADYGYRGDWLTETIELVVPASRFEGLTVDAAMNVVRAERNVVREMIATLRAVKPAREPKRELQVPADIKFVVLP